MKRILMLIMALFFIVPALFAGARSTIRIRLSDGSPLMVSINGRDFKKIGRTVTIGDIPGKRQYLQVYRYRMYADGKGGKAELAYSGNIKIEKGGTYDCIVDLRTQKLRMKEVASLQPIANTPPFNPNLSQPLDQTENQTDNQVQNENTDNDTPLELPVTQEVNPGLSSLKKSMESVDADSKKLAIALAYTNKNTFNSQDVSNIASWIFFDDNRLKFVKQAYAKVSDKSNFAIVANVFTLDDSKKDFNSFLNQQ
ncbi:DUF4476 domain-containing protein [Taibaiella lutea]|uniref:DUF4476 domain-containing protein n=1 Tax=Taibaiella lutea TaxID=2608001 RepID=A0A5M6CTU2_9BACT|nr:DUF4476 domain-containing protein [Taibaiella lutea]KAA5537392.1 DUF4476 domain-containing protein [Taibaiella lutea]